MNRIHLGLCCAVLLQLNSPCRCNAWTRKLSLIKSQGLRWGLLLLALDFTLTLKLGEWKYQTSESITCTAQWGFYGISCPPRRDAWYTLGCWDTFISISNSFLFTIHLLAAIRTHSLLSTRKEPSSLAPSSQKCLPLNPDQLLWASLAHLG